MRVIRIISAAVGLLISIVLFFCALIMTITVANDLSHWYFTMLFAVIMYLTTVLVRLCVHELADAIKNNQED